MSETVSYVEGQKTEQIQPLQIASGWTFGIVVLAFAAVFVLRRPDCVMNPQFWAEDGSIIFRDQLVKGWLAALSIPYRGYFPLLGRLVAGPASAFPIRFAPLIYNVCGVLIDSGCSALFFLPRFRSFIKSDLTRLVLCCLAVSAFQTTELVGALSNSMWYLLLGGILLVLLPPKVDMQLRPGIGVGWCLCGLLIGACAPMVVVGLPIAIYQIVRNFRRGGVISFAITSAALAQTLFAALSSRGLHLARPGVKTIAMAMIGAFAYKVILQALLGASTAFKIAAAKEHGYVISALLVTTIWLIWLTVTSRHSRREVLVPVYLMFGSMLMPFIGRDEAQFFANLGSVDLRGERYFLLASCVFAYLVAYTLDRVVSNRYGVLKALVLVIIFAGGLSGNFHANRFEDLDWQANAKRIEGWAQLRDAGKRAPAVSVRINPPGWSIDLPSI
ncbi:MAG TPA: hypothetical protein VKT29_06195 [Terriglobales bacterium]|nr:hypothetical protein [Terriglobales bacterium]